jgi:hypothetical protein
MFNPEHSSESREVEKIKLCPVDRREEEEEYG